MKIVTWNINFWENWKKENRTEWKNMILDYLDKMEFDFLLLQESNAEILFGSGNGYEDDTQLFYDVDNMFFSEQGYHVYFGQGIELHTYKDKVYYHHLRLNEIIENNDKNIDTWGNSIIAKRKYILDDRCFEKHYYRNSRGIDYCGRHILMCYDFFMENNKTISLINFYGKKDPNGGYPILEYGINDIKDFVDTSNDHPIILAGDFNSDPIKEPENNKIFFKKLKEIGFENCTEGRNFVNTMVTDARPWPNDKVFVNKPYNEMVNCSLINTSKRLSDHKPIECIINFPN